MSAKSRFVYAIRDELAEENGPLFEAPSDAVALRQFGHLLAQVDDVSKGDYKLYRFGEFTEEAGLVGIPGMEIKVNMAEASHA